MDWALIMKIVGIISGIMADGKVTIREIMDLAYKTLEESGDIDRVIYKK